MLEYLISEEELCKFIFGEDFLIKKFKSPLRNDSRANCFVEFFNGHFYFVDWASNKVNTPVWSFYYRLANNNHDKLLKYIDDNKIKADFNRTTSKKDFTGFRKGSKLVTKHPIFFNKRNYLERDKLFWGKGGITIENLLEDRVFAISDFTIFNKRKNKWINRKADLLSYAITEDYQYECKIYQPKSTYYKWRTNFNKNVIFGLKALKYQQDTLYLTKSYKDSRVIRNIDLESISFMNEGMIPDDEFLLPILKRYKNLIIIFDNDRAGIESANKVKTHLLTKGLSLNISLFFFPKGNKDAFEYVSNNSLDKLKRII